MVKNSKGKTWGIESYRLCIDSSLYGVEETADIISTLLFENGYLEKNQ